MLKKISLFLLVVSMILGVLGWQRNLTAGHEQKSQFSMTQGIPILMYHKVNSSRSSGGLGLRVPEDKFDWQMNYIKKNGYHTVTLQDIIDKWDKGRPLPEKPIVITFDDGYQDNYTKAYPILKKYNFTATIFIVTDDVGSYNRWDIQNGQPKNEMLTWEEINQLQKAGFDIESHTVTHPHLAKIKPDEMYKQLLDSKLVLEEKLNKKIAFLAYPFGNYNKVVQEEAKKAGYSGAVVTDPQGKVDNKTNRYALNRVRIMGHYDNNTFVNVLHDPVQGYKLYLENK